MLVRLKNTGNVLLTGDLAHFRENYDNNQVPSWNTSRADTLASLDRFKQIARNLKAVVDGHHLNFLDSNGYVVELRERS